uniref:Copia protein n=1 Tax=Anoplophora glabripennis TaxID=217634 RepID=V5GMX9_ANOGL
MNNTSITATLRGNIQVISNLDLAGVLEDVLYAPDVPYNLLSVRGMQKVGMSVTFHENGGVTIEKGGKVIMTGKSQKCNLITTNFKMAKQVNNAYINYQINANNNLDNNADNGNCKLWHERLGHIGKNKFTEIKTKDLFQNTVPLNEINPTDKLCEACVYGKQSCFPFAKSKNKSHVQRPLFIVHSDLCGPITPSTIDNKNYYVTIRN